MKTRCNSDEILADYLEGRLSRSQRTEMEAHLCECDRCREDLAAVQHVLRGGHSCDTSPVPKAAVSRAQRAVRETLGRRQAPFLILLGRLRRFAFDIGEKTVSFFRWIPGGKPGLAPIRGSRRKISPDVIQLKKTFQKFEVEIEIEKTDSNRATIRVGFAPPKDDGRKVRVTLKRDGREVSSELIESEPVLFENISFGRYCLAFYQNRSPVGNYCFEIKESIHG